MTGTVRAPSGRVFSWTISGVKIAIHTRLAMPARLRRALSDLYAWYLEVEAMLSKVIRESRSSLR